MKQKLLNFFKKRYIIIALTVFITFFLTRQFYYVTLLKETYTLASKLKELYFQDKYDLKRLPDGIVIGIVGVTSTYDSLLTAMPYSGRYHKFEVSIMNPRTRTIHLVIVPLYVIHGIVLGKPIMNGNEEQYQRPQAPVFKEPKFQEVNI